MPEGRRDQKQQREVSPGRRRKQKRCPKRRPLHHRRTRSKAPRWKRAPVSDLRLRRKASYKEVWRKSWYEARLRCPEAAGEASQYPAQRRRRRR